MTSAAQDDLQAYFAEHRIQERLNEWLNELAKTRSITPYAWLSSSMRAVGEQPHATTPELSPASAADIGGELRKAWSSAQSLRGDASPLKPAPKTRAAAPAAAKGGGVVLDIIGAGPRSGLGAPDHPRAVSAHSSLIQVRLPADVATRHTRQRASCGRPGRIRFAARPLAPKLGIQGQSI